MNIVNVKTLFNGKEAEAELHLSPQKDSFIIQFRSDVLDNGMFQGNDLYHAFLSLRNWCDSRDIKLLCNGSRINVNTSGMSRSMGGGKKAYKLSLGKQALRTDIVDIFEYANPEDIGTVNEQKEFYQKWIDSLSKRKP